MKGAVVFMLKNCVFSRDTRMFQDKITKVWELSDKIKRLFVELFGPDNDASFDDFKTRKVREE